MRKIFLLSFDDGTVWDKRFVELLNKYGMKATFNLNSALEDFVWYFEDRFPVRRQKLAETVEQYLREFVDHVYGNLIKAMQERGLEALQEKILDTYQKEKASELVKTTLTENCLQVEVSSCPAVTHLHATGRTVSSWYVYTTTTVMEALAEKIGAKFSMDSYDEATGKASYRICL